MALGFDNYDIVMEAVKNKGSIVNGICAYDCMESKLVGFSLFNNESMHPSDAKHHIFLFKVNQNVEFDMQCWDCNFDDEDWIDPEYENKEECCMECWVEQMTENFDDEEREHIEFQIREIIDRIVWEDLDKLNKIRLGIYREFYSTVQYEQQLYNDNYEMYVLDELVDDAYDNGLSIDEPKKFLSNFVDELMNKLDYIRDENLIYNNLSEEENDLAYNIHEALYAYDLDKCLELLQ